MKLIDKDKVVAEIKRRLEALTNTSAGDNKEFAAIIGAQHYELINLAQYINTLEMKQVDLMKELNNFIEQQKAFVKDDRVVEYDNGDTFNHIYDLEDIAQYFFELGLKAQKGD